MARVFGRAGNELTARVSNGKTIMEAPTDDSGATHRLVAHPGATVQVQVRPRRTEPLDTTDTRAVADALAGQLTKRGLRAVTLANPGQPWLGTLDVATPDVDRVVSALQVIAAAGAA